MATSTPDELLEIRRAVRELCDGFPGEYWRSLEPDRYPEEFVQALTEHGWLAALIPEEYGGAGLTVTAASVVLEEINASGGNAAACHAQMYTMGTLLRHGSEEQKQPANCGCRRSASPSRPSGRTRPGSRRAPGAWTAAT
jgi:acyl-CoA dehydrogenase